MILQSLTMKNFKQYREQLLEFREGLVGIIGKNGSGKSTIFEALLMALYGELPFDKEYLRNSAAGEKETVSVELVFDIEGRRYRVVREYRGKALTPSGRLYDYNDVLLADGQRETTAEVTKLLGMERDAFKRSIFAGQKDLGAISEAGGADRKALVRRMIGMDKLDHVQKMVREDRNRIKSELAGMENLLLSDGDIAAKQKEKETGVEESNKIDGRVRALSEKLDSAQKAYDEAKEAFAEQQGLYRAYNEADKKLAKTITSIESTRKSLGKSNALLEELKKQRKELDALAPAVKEYEEVKKRKEELDRLKEAFRERANLLENKEQQIKERGEINAELEAEKTDAARLSDAEMGLDKAREVVERLEKQEEAARKEYIALNSSSEKLKQLITERRESIDRITAAGRDSVCPTCLRPLKDAYQDTLDRLNGDIERYQKKELAVLEDELKAVEEHLKKMQQDKKLGEKYIEQARNKLAEKKQKDTNVKNIAARLKRKDTLIEDLEKSLKELGEIKYDKKLHDEVIKKQTDLEKTYRHSLELRGRIDGIPRVEKEIAADTESLSNLEKEESVQKKAFEKIPYSEITYKKAEGTQEKREGERDGVREKLQCEKNRFTEVKHRISALEKELKDDKEHRKRLEKQRMAAACLDKLNEHMDGFKNAVLERVGPSIGRYAGELFNQCTRGRYEFIKVNENFDFEILDEGEYFPIERFSGGEVDLANLCLRVAISRVIAELSGSGTTGFLGFDEIFGSQDSERRYEILNAFQQLRERYRQIFIVSHINEVREEFPAILEVSRTPAGSSIRWVEN